MFTGSLSATFVLASGLILVLRYFANTNSLSNFNETYREYSLAPTDDLIRSSRSKVKVTTGRRRDKGIHVDCRRWIVEVHVIFLANSWLNKINGGIFG